MMCLHTL